MIGRRLLSQPLAICGKLKVLGGKGIGKNMGGTKFQENAWDSVWWPHLGAEKALGALQLCLII